MKEEYKEYLALLYNRIPEPVYVGLVSILVIGALFMFWTVGLKKGKRVVMTLLLIEYVSLIYCSTVIFRNTNSASKYKSTSLDNYKEAIVGGSYIAPESLMNVLVFIPLGILICGVFKGQKCLLSLMIGCGISVSIEVLQFVYKRGFTEVVDVFHNTLGCLLGICIFKLVSKLVQRARINYS